MAMTPGSTPQCEARVVEKAAGLMGEFSKSQDLVCKEHETVTGSFGLIYLETLIDSSFMNQTILPKLGEVHEGTIEKHIKSLFQAEDVTCKSIDELSQLLFEGKVLFLIEERLFSIQAGDFPKRQPEESALKHPSEVPRMGL